MPEGIKSMTGYGRGYAAADGREMTIELKSVNHRYLDLNIRLPRHLIFLEDAMRRVITERLSRGHVDVYLQYRNTRNDARVVEIDYALARQYKAASKRLSEELSVADDMSASKLLRIPDIAELIEQEEDRDAVTSLLSDAMGGALDELIGMRASEGARMAEDISQKLQNILSLREKIAALSETVPAEYAKRLKERIDTLLKTDVDESRIAMEAAIFADKAAIDEELVRITSHCTELSSLIVSTEPAGRKLDFMVQELNREFNTIGSKANSADIAKLVVEAKAEIEKMREQVQNIE